MSWRRPRWRALFLGLGIVGTVVGVGATAVFWSISAPTESSAFSEEATRPLPSSEREIIPPLAAATVEEHLSAQVPLELAFRDIAGRPVQLGEFITGRYGSTDPEARPTVLVLAYFSCRTLCSLVLDGTARALGEVGWREGAEYQLLTISIDPRDTPEDARHKRAEVLGILNEGAATIPTEAGDHDSEVEPVSRRVGAGSGEVSSGAEAGTSSARTDGGSEREAWTFLVGAEPEIQALAGTLGFGYHYDAVTDQYSHPAVIFVLTPAGEISSYIYGINPEPAELDAALSSAAAGRTRATLERILLRCFHYIPALRQYAGLIKGMLWACGIFTIIGLGAVLGRLWFRELRGEMSR